MNERKDFISPVFVYRTMYGGGGRGRGRGGGGGERTKVPHSFVRLFVACGEARHFEVVHLNFFFPSLFSLFSFFRTGRFGGGGGRGGGGRGGGGGGGGQRWWDPEWRAAKLAEKHGDGSARALALFVEASTMAASSKGLIRVATSGDLPKLEKAVDDLRWVLEFCF